MKDIQNWLVVDLMGLVRIFNLLLEKSMVRIRIGQEHILGLEDGDCKLEADNMLGREVIRVRGVQFLTRKISMIAAGVYNFSLRIKIEESSVRFLSLSVISDVHVWPLKMLAFGFSTRTKKWKGRSGLKLDWEKVRGKQTEWVIMELSGVVVEREQEFDLFIQKHGGSEDGIVLDFLNIQKLS